MSKAHSIIAESLAASSTLETEETLLGQLDQLERRNNPLRKHAQVRDRVKAVDVCIQKCRQLMGVDDAAAALLYVKCLSLIEETERILNGGGRSSVMSNTNSNVSSLNRIRPIEMQNFHPIETRRGSKQINSWSSSTNNPINVENNRAIEKLPNNRQIEAVNEEEEQYQYNYYGYHKSRWWRILCMNSAKEAKEKDSDVRDLWNTQIEFFISCLGFIVGVGNTMRFPAMLYKYGGMFFIPYLMSMGIFGLPLVYMHLCIGQYSGLSASGAFWKMMPAASGIGWALVLLAVPVAIYYNIIVAWSLYYLWYSLKGIFLTHGLPWSYCLDEWKQNFHCCELTQVSLHTENMTRCYDNDNAMTAPEAFFHYQVLNRTYVSGFEFGDIQMHMVVSLSIAWIIVFFGVFKGIGSIGWAVTITATIPYLMLIILLLRGLSLNGASAGFKYLIKPEFEKLWCSKIWRSAAEQVFYELGIDAGPLISMASFSRYRNNIYRDAVLLVLIDLFTSILCGLVVFSFVGFLATEEENSVENVLKHDTWYLAFTVYPGITSFMDWGFLWAALFFCMLTLSALDAEFAWLEMIASAIMNQLGSKNKSVETRLLVGLCVFFFICGIPLCARGGIFIFHSIENLNANWNSFSLSLMQIIVICFIYGVDKFLEDIGEMLRLEKPPENWVLPGKSRWQIATKRLRHFFGPTGDYIKFSWCVFAPFILMTLLLFSVINYKPVEFNKHKLPPQYEAIAWVVMIGPLFVVPFTVIYTLYETWKRKKSLWPAVSTKNWRHKKTEQAQQHTIDNEGEYMYIDPISRGASAKSRINEPEVNHQPTNEDNYSRANDRIREWAAKSAQNEPLRSIALPSIVTTTDYDTTQYDMDDQQDDSELYGRRTGRLHDVVNKSEPHQKSLQSESSTSIADEEEDTYDPDTERRRTVKKSPFSKSSALGQSDEPPLNLFGPPPVQQPPDAFAQSMSRINKNREQRRSDQRRNRVFNNTFNLVVMEDPSAPSASSSGDRMPSPAVPDRPDITERRRKIGPRKSTESGTNISLSPFNIAPSSSTESTSNDNKDPFPMALSPPTLKRPKPIWNIPSSSSSTINYHEK